MSYTVPEDRREGVRAVADVLREARSVVLTTHINADGDGAGCEVALAAWLRATGRTAWVVNPTPFPQMYAFLLDGELEETLLDADSEEAVAACGSADLAVVLDTGEKQRVGRVKPLIDDLPTVVIDHHQPGEAPLEGLGLRDPRAAATGELLYDVLRTVGGPWPEAAVRGLYVAILTDTGSFRYSNTSPAVHRLAAELLERGVDPEEIYREVYASAPLRRYRLLHAALEHLRVDEEHGVAWITVPRDAFERLGATSDDLEGIVEYPRSVEGVEVALVFRELRPGETKVSFRSSGPADVDELASEFGGGGHRKAAGALVRGGVDEVRERVLARARAVVEEVPAGGGEDGTGGEPGE